MGLRAIRDIGEETAMPGYQTAVNAVNRIANLCWMRWRGGGT